MKVKELYIKKYHQFEDFKLDLTYPDGHPTKAGQPLDKVCFIGQSGTGKTSLLDVISKFMYNLHYFNRMAATHLTDMQDYTTVEGISIKFSGIKEIKARYVDNYIGIEKDNKLVFIASSLDEEFSQCFPIAIFFPVDFTSNVGKLEDHIKEDDRHPFLYFSGLSYSEIWHKINQSITEYKEKQTPEKKSISEITDKSDFTSDELFEATKKFKEWEQNNPNPLQSLGNKGLDKILNKFNLRLRTKLDFEKIEDASTIKLEDFEGNEVPYKFQSTGTRHIFLSLLSLYTLKPNRTAIFFDEPERSLYPDIQKEIVDIYTSLTTDCQFFYATHSPIIASSFEPWEIVELKFKDGKVVQELYFEGERHVDNYTINPQYLRWDDILGRLFDLEEEGNSKRTKALMRLAILESKLKKNIISQEEKETLWQEYLKLSKLTGWTTRFTNEKN